MKILKFILGGVSSICTIFFISNCTKKEIIVVESSCGLEDLLANVKVAFYKAGDGPGYYSAMVNVKGKVIYGYTRNLRHANEGTGTYRITFSLDSEGDTATLNTFFDQSTQILVPIEEEVPTESGDSEGSRGGIGIIIPDNNLTYMDIRIREGQGQDGGGGGGGHNNGGGGSGGGGDHGS